MDSQPKFYFERAVSILPVGSPAGLWLWSRKASLTMQDCQVDRDPALLGFDNEIEPENTCLLQVSYIQGPTSGGNMTFSALSQSYARRSKRAPVSAPLNPENRLEIRALGLIRF